MTVPKINVFLVCWYSNLSALLTLDECYFVIAGMACRRLGQMVLSRHRLWPVITTNKKAMQIPRRCEGSLSFDTFKARLDQKLEESRMKPTAEADLDLELTAESLDAQVS